MSIAKSKPRTTLRTVDGSTVTIDEEAMHTRRQAIVKRLQAADAETD